MTALMPETDATDLAAEEVRIKTRAALAEIAIAYGDLSGLPTIPPSAPCRAEDANPEDWYVLLRDANGNELVGPSYRRWQQQRARELCAGCPVLTECLAWAIKNREEYGVWGGMIPDERRQLARRPSRIRTA